MGDGAGNVVWSAGIAPELAAANWRRRPATAANIANGHAIFELGGKGKLAPIKLPAVGTLIPPVVKSVVQQTGLILSIDGGQSVQQNGLILQAEIGADGKTLYGAVGENILRAIAAEQLADVKPLEPSQHGIESRQPATGGAF